MGQLSRNKIIEIQAKRAAKYPMDRICFHSSETSASEDQKVIKMYVKGEINLKTLCKSLARNNYLDFVTEWQAINELQIMGWIHG